MKTNVKEYDHFRVHTIKKDNYKKCAIEIHCREKINKDNLGKVKALFDLLNRGTKSYPSIK